MSQQLYTNNIAAIPSGSFTNLLAANNYILEAVSFGCALIDSSATPASIVIQLQTASTNIITGQMSWAGIGGPNGPASPPFLNYSWPSGLVLPRNQALNLNILSFTIAAANVQVNVFGFIVP